MPDNESKKEQAIALAKQALILLDELRERGPAALIQQAIDELSSDRPAADS